MWTKTTALQQLFLKFSLEFFCSWHKLFDPQEHVFHRIVILKTTPPTTYFLTCKYWKTNFAIFIQTLKGFMGWCLKKMTLNSAQGMERVEGNPPTQILTTLIEIF